VELDCRLGRDLGQLLGRQAVEWRALREEAGDLAQAGVQLALLGWERISIPER
jgi:hypothetical protein